MTRRKWLQVGVMTVALVGASFLNRPTLAKALPALTEIGKPRSGRRHLGRASCARLGRPARRPRDRGRRARRRDTGDSDRTARSAAARRETTSGALAPGADARAGRPCRQHDRPRDQAVPGRGSDSPRADTGRTHLRSGNLLPVRGGPRWHPAGPSPQAAGVNPLRGRHVRASPPNRRSGHNDCPSSS